MSPPTVRVMRSPADIGETFLVMSQLRPQLAQKDYTATIERMMTGGFELAAVLVDGRVVSVAGFRVLENLAASHHMYVDDLVSDQNTRSHGHGKLLLDWLKNEARTRGCAELHLDSGVQRHGAHRFYLRERMDISSYHFKIPLP